MFKFFFSSVSNVSFGMLVLRIGIGLMIMLHGIMKFLGGKNVLVKVGSAAEIIGFDSGHLFFGITAALIETIGGILVVSGLFFIPSCFLISIVLIVAFLTKIIADASFLNFSYPLEMSIVFISMALIGAGKYSFDNKIIKIYANRNSNIK